MGHIHGANRHDVLLFPERLDDDIAEDNPVRFLDACVDELERIGVPKPLFPPAPPPLRPSPPLGDRGPRAPEALLLGAKAPGSRLGACRAASLALARAGGPLPVARGASAALWRASREGQWKRPFEFPILRHGDTRRGFRESTEI